MESITIKNFRCFGDVLQTPRLAPLTLLVGENSTGKTSFMAIVRALWDVAYSELVPSFLEPPYDLGSFDDIAHSRGARGGKARFFEAAFTIPEKSTRANRSRNGSARIVKFSVRFKNHEGAPYPMWRRIENDASWVECEQDDPNGDFTVRYSVGGETRDVTIGGFGRGYERGLVPFGMFPFFLDDTDEEDERRSHIHTVSRLIDNFQVSRLRRRSVEPRPFASSPIRSRPSRTYNRGLPSRDPEGEYVPTLLARASMHGGQEWKKLNGLLVEFGKNSGLFDELDVKHLGHSESGPFEIRVRKQGRYRKGPFRNLVDVGYGVSQVLPILTELLREDAPNTFLLQQPEVHLHPSAQAALGTLFCGMATTGKQLIVETHSDHLIDRVRMDVRDGSTDLKPEDVSILYFERNELEVKIHSLGIDKDGEIFGAPLGYRQFFMDEVNRSIGFVPLEA